MSRIAIEGLSGAGKTSSLTYIIQAISTPALLLPELNPPLHVLRSRSQLNWRDYHFLWKERVNVLKASNKKMKIFFDRTYYSTLAFSYATGDIASYNKQMDMIKSDFAKDFFDTLFVLITDPKTGLERRLKNQGALPHSPWNDPAFLEKMKLFYTEKLPEIYKKNIFLIDTTKKTLNEVVSCICKHISVDFLNAQQFNTNCRDESENKLLLYAEKEKLGRPYTRSIEVFGLPTIYFRQYALQLHNNQPTYLDTLQLFKLLKQRNSA